MLIIDNPSVRLSLVLPLQTYWVYFEQLDLVTFCGCYAAVLCHYQTETENAAAVIIHKEVSHMIYNAA